MPVVLDFINGLFAARKEGTTAECSGPRRGEGTGTAGEGKNTVISVRFGLIVFPYRR